MKALFISYNQAYNEEIVEILEGLGQRGFTRWQDIQGRGGIDGEPHYGDHAWPTMNHAVLAMVEDETVAPALERLKAKDAEAPDLGLRAYVWKIEKFC
ncbi:MAG: hypothetical protein MJY57_00025 [Bacteroidales bacterium]|nr:hypothetical protein [Bacteroidales bacterium]